MEGRPRARIYVLWCGDWVSRAGQSGTSPSLSSISVQPAQARPAFIDHWSVDLRTENEWTVVRGGWMWDESA